MQTAQTTVDPTEVAKFEAMAAEWWDPKGKFKPLHMLNPCRLDYITGQIAGEFGRDLSQDRPFEGLRLLDIGCGDGGFLRNLSYIHRRVGLDIVHRKLETDIEFVLHDLTQKMPFDKASFDAIFAGEILEHLFDTDHFLRECHRVLKPGGTLILVEPGEKHLQELREIIYAEPSSEKTEIKSNNENDYTLIDTQTLEFKIELTRNEQILNLLSMTPHLFRANSEGKASIENMDSLSLTTDIIFKSFEYKPVSSQP